MKNSGGRITRRRLALLAGAALPASSRAAAAPAVQPEPPSEPAEAAEQSRRRNAADVATLNIPGATEPAFRFEA